MVVTQCFDTAGHAPTQTYLSSSLVDNVFSGKYCATAYNHDKERIDLPPPLTRIEMEGPEVVKFELHPQKNSKR